MFVDWGRGCYFFNLAKIDHNFHFSQLVKDYKAWASGDTSRQPLGTGKIWGMKSWKIHSFFWNSMNCLPACLPTSLKQFNKGNYRKGMYSNFLELHSDFSFFVIVFNIFTCNPLSLPRHSLASNILGHWGIWWTWNLG